MAFPVIYKGGDEVISITLTDSDGVAINPNDCEDIIISVYKQIESIIQSFSLSESSVIIQDADDGIVRVMLDKENTSKVAAGRLLMQVEVLINNTQFGKVQSFKIADIALCDLKASV